MQIIIIQNFITGINGRQEKIRKVPVELWTAKNSIAPNYRLMPPKQHTETCYRTNNLRFWFKTRQDKYTTYSYKLQRFMFAMLFTKNSVIADKPRDAFVHIMQWRGRLITSNCCPPHMYCRAEFVHFRSNSTSVITEMRLKNLTTCVSHLSWSFKVTGTDTDRSTTYDFLLRFHSKHGPISYRVFNVRVEGFPLELINNRMTLRN